MAKVKKVDLNKINRMLMEMARGNFEYRLPRSERHDTVEAMITILNMLAEEIQEALVHQGFANTNGTTVHTVQMHFLLDKTGLIEMVNPNACSLLCYLQKDILGRPFGDFLDPKSQGIFKKSWKSQPSKGFHDTVLGLTFRSKEGLLLKKPCHLNTFNTASKKDRRTVVTVIHHTKDHTRASFKSKSGIVQKIGQQQSGNRPKLSFEDIRKIRKGHALILNNLDRELPSLKDFAHELGTNEFKLKYGFRQLYGTSVYRFQLQERLRKAKMLVEHTDLSLKAIAYRTGFKSIPHFSRVFKKTYDMPPSMLRKSTPN